MILFFFFVFFCFSLEFQEFEGQELVLEVTYLAKLRTKSFKRLKESRRASNFYFGELLVMPWCDHCTPQCEL